jgi:hypothetical protein
MIYIILILAGIAAFCTFGMATAKNMPKDISDDKDYSKEIVRGVKILLLAAIITFASCATPCKPCKTGYKLVGDTCYMVIKPSRIY